VLLTRHAIPTGDDPSIVITEVIAWLRAEEAHFGPFAGIGVASFGPIDLDPQSPDVRLHHPQRPRRGGRTPDLLASLRQAFAIPIGFDTDVNGGCSRPNTGGEQPKGLMTSSTSRLVPGIGGGGMSGR